MCEKEKVGDGDEGVESEVDIARGREGRAGGRRESKWAQVGDFCELGRSRGKGVLRGSTERKGEKRREGKAGEGQKGSRWREGRRCKFGW